MAVNKVDLLIIGSGAAGLTAAIYAGRANLKPVLFAGDQPGGQLTITTEVENFPGFEEPVLGPELMAVMRKQAERYGTKVHDLSVLVGNFQKSPFMVKTSDGAVYEARSVIIATGAKAKWLGIPGEKEFLGFGVSACATCDGFFFREAEVAVIGGGNTAAEEALFLTKFAKKVYLIHRRDTLRAEAVMQEKIFAHPKIQFIPDTVTEEMIGEGEPPRLTGLKLKNLKTGENSVLKIDGAFVAIGHQPQTELFKDQLKLDEENYLPVKPGGTETGIPGLFAAGDVSDKIYRQAVTAAGTGCMAALDAIRFLESLE